MSMDSGAEGRNLSISIWMIKTACRKERGADAPGYFPHCLGFCPFVLMLSPPHREFVLFGEEQNFQKLKPVTTHAETRESHFCVYFCRDIYGQWPWLTLALGMFSAESMLYYTAKDRIMRRLGCHIAFQCEYGVHQRDIAEMWTRYSGLRAPIWGCPHRYAFSPPDPGCARSTAP